MNYAFSLDEVTIRSCTLDDVTSLVEIESLGNTPPWTPPLFQSEFSLDHSTTFGAWSDIGQVGFVVCHALFETGHIVNLAVLPNWRRRGIGRKLIAHALEHFKQAHCEVATLEVRESNGAARRLYESLGFVLLGVRPLYYTDNSEDALIMSFYL